MRMRLILLLTIFCLPLCLNFSVADAQEQPETGVSPDSGFSNQLWLPVIANPGRADAQADTVLASDLASTLKTQGATDQTSIIVILRDQTNVKTVTGKNRKDKRKNLVNALRKKANDTQLNLRARLATWQSQGQVQAIKPLWVLNGIALTATSAVINSLAQMAEVDHILLDSTLQAPAQATASTPVEPNLSLINAPALWELGFSGQGIVVANLDTGVDVTHPDLAARWRGGNNSWYDPYGQHATPTDLNGHGTWTMGIMVGGSNGGTAIGVAPQAQWIAVKIFNDSNSATVSAIHQAYQWLLDPDNNPATSDAPDVVNNSWSFGTPGCTLTFQPDLQALLAAEIVPVFAAGNYGPGSPTDVSPANNPEAFSVGALSDSTTSYVYSSNGPTSCGRSSAAIYPSLSAPGVDIKSTGLYNSYSQDSGTSLAAPHVAGVLALLLSAYPNLTASRQAAALLNSTTDLGIAGPDNLFGYGRLDALSAYQWLSVSNNNLAPTVNAGADQSITLPATAQLNGAATDDGQPTPTLTTQWSTVSGPGTVTFATPQALQTAATFSAAGQYTLRLTVSDGQLSSSDDIVITVAQPNLPPTVNAGADQSITLPATAQLNGTATDDGQPTPTLTTQWSTVSSPGTVTFATPQALQTAATFSTAGTYTLRLTVSDGLLSSSDDIVITVAAQPNLAPTVNAGADQSITLPATAQLNGAATDDGQPTPAKLTMTWSKVSGPGTVTFATPQALQTSAAFSLVGSYTLRLTVSDGLLSTSDDVVITVSGPVLYLSASANGTVGGVAYQDEDIIVYNPATNRWSLVLDGSDVGLGNSDIDAFDILADGSFLLSLDSGLTLSGPGAVKDTDILRFTPTTLGNTTAGLFTFYLRGADVGLTTTDEDIDALDLLPDGRLLFSTLGNVSMTGVSGADEDLVVLNLTTKAAALYFDGSAVGLSATNEDLWGTWSDGAGQIYLSTQGSFAVTGASGTGADIFICKLLATGLNTTNCTFSNYWKGATAGFSGVIDDFILLSGGLPLLTPAAPINAASLDEGPSNLDDDPLNGDSTQEEAPDSSADTPVQAIFLPLIRGK